MVATRYRASVMGDHHLHLHPHGYAGDVWPPPDTYPEGRIEAYVEAAAARGVAELGFTEHLYRCVESASVLGEFWQGGDPRLADQTRAFVLGERNLSLETYVEQVTAAADRGLPVRLGLEVDYFPDTIDAVLDMLEPYPWDFLIGSVHWIGAWSVDHDGASWEFDRRGVDRAYAEYFAVETSLAESGAVDVLAHADVIKKFGHRPSVDPSPWYRELAAAAGRSGVAVEINSAGLRNACKEEYPAPDLLAAFHAEGVPITLASDAHAPEDAAWGHDEVFAAAKRAGYATRVRFERRERFEVPLES